MTLNHGDRVFGARFSPDGPRINPIDNGKRLARMNTS